VAQPQDPVAIAALATGLNLGSLTEQGLGNPESQSLLSYPLRTGNEEQLRQPSLADGSADLLSLLPVPCQRRQCHEVKVKRGGEIGSGLLCNMFFNNNLAEKLRAILTHKTWSECCYSECERTLLLWRRECVLIKKCKPFI
jgi:hypothetical protein